MTHEADFRVYCEGSIFLLTPLTEAANLWVDEHLPEDRMTFAGATVVEHRYINDLVEALIAEGYTVN